MLKFKSKYPAPPHHKQAQYWHHKFYTLKNLTVASEPGSLPPQCPYTVPAEPIASMGRASLLLSESCILESLNRNVYLEKCSSFTVSSIIIREGEIVQLCR